MLTGRKMHYEYGDRDPYFEDREFDHEKFKGRRCKNKSPKTDRNKTGRKATTHIVRSKFKNETNRLILNSIENEEL